MPRRHLPKSFTGTTAESVGIDLKGFDELMQNLERLKSSTQRKVARLAVTAGARIVRNEAKRLVPVRTGNLRDSISIKVLPYRRTEHIAARVFASRIRGKQGWHAHLIEFGTAPRYQKPKEFKHLSPFLAKRAMKESGKRGRYTGIGPARPFMRPALDNRRSEILAAYKRILKAGIEREFAKRGMKVG